MYFKLHMATGGSLITKVDQKANNGLVQVLDKVLEIPHVLRNTLKEKQFSIFFGMIEKTDVIAYLIDSK